MAPSIDPARGRATKKTAGACRTGHYPSWARTRTLLIQRGRCNLSNSGNLPTFTRVRVTRCRSLKAFMPDFAVLYSLKCRGLSHAFGLTTNALFSVPAARTEDLFARPEHGVARNVSLLGRQEV